MGEVVYSLSLKEPNEPIGSDWPPLVLAVKIIPSLESRHVLGGKVAQLNPSSSQAASFEDN